MKRNEGEESSEELSELERLLEELFTDYGKHDTVQEDGVEVNFFSLPEKKANYIDIVEDKLTPALERAFDSHGEEKMKEVSKLAKKLIPKYDGNQEIFLEFVTLWIDLKIGEEAFIRGVQDTLTANDMYDIAIQIGAGYSAGKMAGVLIKKMTAKYPKTIGTKLGSKAIPYVGWTLGAYTITTATIENADLAQNCASSEDEIDGENTQYYCGKLMVNGILSLGGVAVSKVNIKGVYKNRTDGINRREIIKPCTVSQEGSISVANNNGCVKWSNQDKEMSKQQLNSVAMKAGFGNIEAFKQDLLGKESSKWDAFRNSDGEVYFKAKTGKGNSFEPMFTGFIFK